MKNPLMLKHLQDGERLIDKRRWKQKEETYLCREHILKLDELELRVRDGYGCSPDDAMHWGSCQLEELGQPVLYITL